MKIAILTTSSTTGGAAIVTARLADALQALGHEVRLFTLEGKRERKPAFLMERLGIFMRNGLNRKNLFKGSMADFGQHGLVKTVEEWVPDAVVMGWINQGLLSLRQIDRLATMGKPIAWIMHDMWCFTGFCHHSLGCMRYTDRCGRCPLLSSRGPKDLSYKGWRRKRKAYGLAPNLKFVAVSRWLQSMAARSSLLRDRDVAMVPNVFPIERFAIGGKEPGLIAMGAERLDDPIKGLHHAVDALNKLDPALGAHVAFFGNIQDRSALEKLRVPYELVGMLTPQGVADLLGRAQVVLSSSLYETLPTTLIEGQASGAVPVSYDRGGQADIVDHLRSGYLAPFGDSDALSRGIAWAMEGRITPESLRAEVERKFGAEAVAHQLLELLK